MRPELLLVLFVLTVGIAHASHRAVDDFAGIDEWSVHKDGGHVEMSLDSHSGLRLVFDNREPGWGNAVRAVQVPPNATSMMIQFRLREAQSGAGLSVWLFEEDGDAHHWFVMPGGEHLGSLSPGEYVDSQPLVHFRFDARGSRSPAILTVDRIVVGINSGRADVTITGLEFVLAGGERKLPEQRTQDLRVEDGPRGRIALLRDDFSSGSPASSNPDVLRDTLRRAGFGVTPLRAGDVADPAVLTAASFDCLVLPFGRYYPYSALDAIQAYLKSGGSFFSTGGYAFDEPCGISITGEPAPVLRTPPTAAEIAAGATAPRSLNTRYGRSGDTMGLDPDQIGVFDPAFLLRGESIAGLVDEKVRVEGYAARSMLGSNNPVFPEQWGRHVTLVEALDSLGRPAGPVGSIAHNFAGPYAGSSWAFFGATNVDLFASGRPLLEQLPDILDSLVRKTYLHSLVTDLAGYLPGETVRISARVANHGKGPLSASARVTVNGERGEEVFTADLPVSVGSPVLETEFALNKPQSDLYTVRLSLGDDSIETGFVALRPDARPRDLELRYVNNYFEVNGKPTLLSGTNVTGAMLCSGFENPLVWDADLAMMSDCGLNIVRLLHFSPFIADKPAFASTKPADLALDRLPLKIERKLDSLVYLCRRNGIALFLTIHDWMPVELTAEELEAQRGFARLIAERYRDVPGFLIDIQNEPSIILPGREDAPPPEPVTTLWNDHLRAKYGSNEALREAWQLSLPEAELGSIPYRAGRDAWEDVRTLDADEFRNVLVRRWARANSEGAKLGDPAMPVTIGFLQEYHALNKLACVSELDLANMHSYSSLETLRADMKLFDRRFEGRSLSLGEFGALNDHNKRVDGKDVVSQDIGRFLHTGHYLFGEGGSFLLNWCWKDMDDVIFPWGIRHANGGPRKDILKAFRNQSLLFRGVRPQYRSPAVFLVVPVGTMLGGRSGIAVRLLYDWVQALLDARIDFGVIDDRSLDKLPESARVLVYPIPFAVPDDAYARLRGFVEGGGTLCITGDVSYDNLRRRTRTDRLQELCGVEFTAENYAGTDWPSPHEPCIGVKPTDAQERDGVFVRKLGKGRVCYTPSPLGPPDRPLALIVPLNDLGADGTVRVDVTGESPRVHAFRLLEQGGGRVVVLVNDADAPARVRVTEPGMQAVDLRLAPKGTGMVQWNASGETTAVEFQDEVTMGRISLTGKGHFGVVFGTGVAAGSALVIPFGQGKLDLGGLAAQDALTQTGDVIDGAWKVLGETPGAEVRALGDTAFDIRLVGTRKQLEHLGRQVESQLLLR